MEPPSTFQVSSSICPFLKHPPWSAPSSRVASTANSAMTPVMMLVELVLTMPAVTLRSYASRSDSWGSGSPPATWQASHLGLSEASHTRCVQTELAVFPLSASPRGLPMSLKVHPAQGSHPSPRLSCPVNQLILKPYIFTLRGASVPPLPWLELWQIPVSPPCYQGDLAKPVFYPVAPFSGSALPPGQGSSSLEQCRILQDHTLEKSMD